MRPQKTHLLLHQCIDLCEVGRIFDLAVNRRSHQGNCEHRNALSVLINRQQLCVSLCGSYNLAAEPINYIWIDEFHLWFDKYIFYNIKFSAILAIYIFKTIL